MNPTSLSWLTRSLQLLPPEASHRLAVRALRAVPLPRLRPAAPERLATTWCGFELAHPLGLAAGFDKDALVSGALLGFGFSFVEVGTITPRPQPGNPPPRLFRLPEDGALINRFGFNSLGVEAARARLAARHPALGIVGANIGINRDSDDPLRDYVTAFRRLYDVADYLAVNVSSPNTPGLREWQGHDALARLLEALLEARAGLARGDRPKPLLVKVAPDLGADEEAAIAEVALACAVDGLIVSNTTIARPPGLKSRQRNESGGLSGPPLFARSTELLRRMYQLTGGRLPLVGVGGITTAEDAYAKIRAGACALQLYTALVYQGPAVIPRVLAGLDRLLVRDGYATIAAAVGSGT